MNVVLVHQTHGAKVAMNQAELDADLRNGWKEYKQESTPVVNTLVKRGRKPKEKPAPESFLGAEAGSDDENAIDGEEEIDE